MAAIDEEIFELELDDEGDDQKSDNDKIENNNDYFNKVDDKPEVDNDKIENNNDYFNKVDDKPEVDNELDNINQAEDERQETTELCAENVNTDKLKLGPADFKFKTMIGEGGYGKVFLVRKIAGRNGGKYFAMKVLRKAPLVDNPKDEAHTRSERLILETVRHPFIVELAYAFQTQEKLYLIMEYMNGGELFSILTREVHLKEDAARFFACEIVLALGHLHQLGVIYRDLKPDNILLDAVGHIKLTDFGLCKENIKADIVTHTYCGTIEYMAPEVINRSGHGKAVDWWSLGALMYEMLVGEPPFTGNDKPQRLRAVLRGSLYLPGFLRYETKDLLGRLLNRNVSHRLGSGPTDALAIQRHSFFKNVNWDDVLHKRVKPPFKPDVQGPSDFSNFEEIFTSQAAVDLPSGSPLCDNVNFEGFSYEAPSFLEERRCANQDVARSPRQRRND